VAASGPRLPGLAEVCLERLSELRARRSSASVSGARSRLSLVTSSLDQGAFIERTLLSVLGQGLDGLEYVVMDGGSRDGTLAILRRHQAALRYVSRPDAGQADAVNAGLRTTSGDLVGWLNSDDVSYTGALDAVVRFFDAHPEVDLVYGEADHIDAHDQVLGRYPTEDWDFERLKETCFLCQPAVFLRRRVLERFGLLDVRLRYCMDYEYWLRVGAHLRPARLRQRLAGSRLHPAAKTLHARVAVHAEINSMLRRRLGFVPERWLHNYAWAVVDAAGHDRARLEDYAGRLTRATLWAFVRWRGRIPRRVLATAGGWLREARLRRAGAAARA
jgi:glycosyltransferase involved in cell wall biosynthesis